MAERKPRGGAGGGDWQRYAAPIAFLVAVTVAVLLVRGSFGEQAQTTLTTSAATTTTAPATTAKTKQTKKKKTAGGTAAAEYYEVQAGDTFGVIASKYGKTVDEIEALNPGVSSTLLHVGQKIRVG